MHGAVLCSCVGSGAEQQHVRHRWFGNLEEAVEFARRLPANQHWRFAIRSRDTRQVAFELQDDGGSQLFRAITDRNGEAHITRAGNPSSAPIWIKGAFLVIGIALTVLAVLLLLVAAALVGAFGGSESPVTVVIPIAIAIAMGSRAIRALRGLRREQRFDEALATHRRRPHSVADHEREDHQPGDR